MQGLVPRILLTLMAFSINEAAMAQENTSKRAEENHQFFDGIVMEEEDNAPATELKEMLDLWLEHPLNVNSEEAGHLAEQGLISIFQLNKLKEYRMMYGNLLSIYELKNIDGWNLDLAQKVAPYLSTGENPEAVDLSSPQRDRCHQQLVLKTSVNPELRKGYKENGEDSIPVQPHYLGSPFRMSLRYDLTIGKLFEFGLRMEKDQGEPLMLKNELLKIEYQGVDHLSAFIKFNFRRLLKTVIIGDYRMAFGYGLNYSGGSMMSGTAEGLIYPAHRHRANTSMSESGYLRGASVYLQKGHIGLTGFISFNKFDGTSIETDTMDGKPISFSSIDISGLHRTASEISQRKLITEQIYGGHLVFMNNWLKLGLISYYSCFDIPMELHHEPYARFRFSGKSNLISGLTMAIWLRRIRVASEFSISRNKALALIAGAEFIPVNGISLNLIYRHFDRDYQNLHGSGFNSGSNNDNETGVQAVIRMETAAKWLISLIADVSETRWVSYQLNAPSRKWFAMLAAERAWRDKGGIYLYAKYRKETMKNPGEYSRVIHPVYGYRMNFRLEGRYMVLKRFTFKTRAENNLYYIQGGSYQSGWLFMQDIGYTPLHLPFHVWMRIGFFESEGYETRLYAYENDVLYDFSSFMHDGKGLRAVLLMKYSPWKWLDCWFRISSVNYRDRPVISSGWDEVEGSRLEEIEVQIRIKL